MTDKAAVEVAQADREAAWPYRPECYNSESDWHAWFAGRYDNCRVIQAFAAHRHQYRRQRY